MEISYTGIADAATPDKRICLVQSKARYYDELGIEDTTPRFSQQVVVASPAPSEWPIPASDISAGQTNMNWGGAPSSDCNYLLIELVAYSTATLAWPSDFTSFEMIVYAPSNSDGLLTSTSSIILERILLNDPAEWFQIGTQTTSRRHALIRCSTHGFPYVAVGGIALAGNANLRIAARLRVC